MAFVQMGGFARHEAEPQPRLGAARVIPKGDWDICREEIIDLYIDQEKSLAELMELMEDKLKATYDALKHF
jgi:Clr5 domain